MNSTVEDSVAEQRLPKPEEKRGLTRFLRRYGTQVGILTVFVLMWLFFIISAPKTFLAPQIYLAFMSTIPFFAIIALPLTMLVIAGEMDLSFPSIMAMGMVAFVTVFVPTGNVFLALLAGLLVGFLAGLLNGVIVVGIGLPSLVVTIGTQFFWRAGAGRF
jgi:simple sugar transport system permease protein